MKKNIGNGIDNGEKRKEEKEQHLSLVRKVENRLLLVVYNDSVTLYVR